MATDSSIAIALYAPSGAFFLFCHADFQLRLKMVRFWFTPEAGISCVETGPMVD